MITRAELAPVTILVLKGLANAKLAAARITSAIEASGGKIFMLEEIHSVLTSANWNCLYSTTTSLDRQRSIEDCEADHFCARDVRTVTCAFRGKEERPNSVNEQLIVICDTRRIRATINL